MALTKEDERMLQQLGWFMDYAALVTKSRLCAEWAKEKTRGADNGDR